jgi:hypothetical protein
MKLSNDGGFAGAQWRPFISTTNWTLDAYGTYVVQRTVRAVFKDADGHIITGPSDDIIYDHPPTVNVSEGKWLVDRAVHVARRCVAATAASYAQCQRPWTCSCSQTRTTAVWTAWN